jgi:glycosyltransferase involved in cell wall biosynthesis
VTIGAKVTVGIPTYNRASLLAESIDSVLSQTFGDVSIVISDIASRRRNDVSRCGV